MLEFHWNGQRSAVCGDGVHFFLPKRLNLFSLSFSLSFSRLPGLDSLVIVTLAGRVWARLEAGVLWVVGDTSILSEEIADVMAWIHVFISSFKKPQRQKAVTIRVSHALSNSLNIVEGEWIEVGNERKHGANSSSDTPLSGYAPADDVYKKLYLKSPATLVVPAGTSESTHYAHIRTRLQTRKLKCSPELLSSYFFPVVQQHRYHISNKQ